MTPVPVALNENTNIAMDVEIHTTAAPIAGIEIGTASAGLRSRTSSEDIAVVRLAPTAEVAVVFTRNAFAAAPVQVAREHLASGTEPRYLLYNSANANAGLGAQGVAAARECCRELAHRAGVEESAVLPFSTGVIGEPLPTAKVIAALDTALASLGEDHWLAAAQAIMTTDAWAKLATTELRWEGGCCQVSGLAKGAGMIRPDMATMLALVATDAAVPSALLGELLSETMDQSFHCITVDGDTSTNDACVLVATGMAPAPPTELLREALCAVCHRLAREIVRDGEGARRIAAIRVRGGADREECRAVGFTLAQSPLFKTALYAADPNWGRILAAIGRAGLPDFEVDKVRIELAGEPLVIGGERAPNYSEAQGQRAFAADEVQIDIYLGRGQSEAQVWGSDLSPEYLRINSEYRT